MSQDSSDFGLVQRSSIHRVPVRAWRAGSKFDYHSVRLSPLADERRYPVLGYLDCQCTCQFFAAAPQTSTKRLLSSYSMTLGPDIRSGLHAPAYLPSAPILHAGSSNGLPRQLELISSQRRKTKVTKPSRHGPLRWPSCCGSTVSNNSGAHPTPSSQAESTGLKDSSDLTILQLFRREPVLPPETRRVVRAVCEPPLTVHQETCFNVALTSPLTSEMRDALIWLLSETFDPSGILPRSHFPTVERVIEVGPRLNFQTAWSANAVTICHACGVPVVSRLERSRRYVFVPTKGDTIPEHVVESFSNAIHDRMTETVYASPLTSFETPATPAPSYSIDVLKDGKSALVEASKRDGLGFDDQDIQYYYTLFAKTMKRNPTNVELFDLAQSNSEHSRHWFFKGKLHIDGREISKHLLDVVRDTLRANPRNSVIAFADNSSTIRGFSVPVLRPILPGTASPLRAEDRDRDVLFTAETHNFPSGVAPFPGAETGTGGRIRDTAATGVGSLVGAATAGYAVGNLHIPGHELPWEDSSFTYPSNLASPLEILIEASNGASDYGNKFGEPVINGFARSYGLRLPSGERREYVKPIMFSGGMGQMEHMHATKGEARVGLLVVKVGGPAYRIGMGGGAASSMMQGENKEDLDFNAVQRGDAEMAQKVYRVLRACVEMGSLNPIVSIHDQGAGGNCNVVKELIYPAGAKIDVRKVWVGDKSLSALEIWGAEYQEQFGLLLLPEHWELFNNLCKRENVVAASLGTVDGSGRIVLWDSEEGRNVVDMDLDAVLGDLPQKHFIDTRAHLPKNPIRLPDDCTVEKVLRRVLSLMTVGSKRFLTTKVDRSVTGLVAQQQCVGPLQLPLADYGVTALSYFSTRGCATAIGERPGLTNLDPGAMARMSVGEMMTNIAGAKLTAREDIKCEGNWMWAAKLAGDCASLYDAAIAMRDVMVGLGIAVDGGKDSLSMAAKCSADSGKTETVRAPGTLVVSGYCTVDDVTAKLTPDLKAPGESRLLHVDISNGKRRIGGGSLGQVYEQVGEVAPDLDDVGMLQKAFDCMQSLIGNHDVLSYHDISDGGLITTVLEMSFGGNCGVDVMIDSGALGVDCVASLFAEELGFVIEVRQGKEDEVRNSFSKTGVRCDVIGSTRSDYELHVMDRGVEVLGGDVRLWRDVWEATSFALERQQSNIECVRQEQDRLRERTGPEYMVPWSPRRSKSMNETGRRRPRVAIVREEGSNGDREMAAAFHMAGFETWDVCMRDIGSGIVSMKEFDGAAFVGGFSFGDVLDSAKGWAGVVRLNERVKLEFEEFFERKDSFSLGVCNGCQLLALLGRVPFNPQLEATKQPRFVRNTSGRYESRFVTVMVEDANRAIMLRGMSGGRLGVWVAHGEGRAVFPDKDVLRQVEESQLVALRYVDESGSPTMLYPDNPNGSANSIAGLCSSDGRHLALMPHPERCVLKWQWPFLPDSVGQLEASPWLTMFQNAFDWVVESRQNRQK